MKSYGPVDIGGTVVNLVGEQVNIGSSNEVVIDGGKRLELVADILTIRNRRSDPAITGTDPDISKHGYGQVLVDSNLGVSENVVIGGGLHVEGELTVQHITAPVEIQETEQTKIWGRANDLIPKIIGYTWNLIPCDIPGSSYTPIYSMIPDSSGNPCVVADHDSQYMYPHSHHFKNLPLHLKKTNDGVREKGKSCNHPRRTPANKTEVRMAKNKVT
jgi:hypothetical protein